MNIMNNRDTLAVSQWAEVSNGGAEIVSDISILAVHLLEIQADNVRIILCFSQKNFLSSLEVCAIYLSFRRA